MKNSCHEMLGKFVSWFILKSIKCAIILSIVIFVCIGMYEVQTEYIKIEIWDAFDTQYQIEREEFMRNNGIIDEHEGIINFYDEQAGPVNI